MLMKTTTPPQDVTDEGTPVSVKIRERLVLARKRFNANDNIAEFIKPGELASLLDEVEAREVFALLAEAGELEHVPLEGGDEVP